MSTAVGPDSGPAFSNLRHIYSGKHGLPYRANHLPKYVQTLGFPVPRAKYVCQVKVSVALNQKNRGNGVNTTSPERFLCRVDVSTSNSMADRVRHSWIYIIKEKWSTEGIRYSRFPGVYELKGVNTAKEVHFRNPLSESVFLGHFQMDTQPYIPSSFH